MEQDKVSQWRYGVHCVGIKKRARTKNRHNEINLGRSPLFDKDLAESCAKKWVLQNMKTIERVEVVAHRIDLIKENDGVTIEHWEPFTEADNKRWAIEAASCG